jgi:hypothetical protein
MYAVIELFTLLWKTCFLVFIHFIIFKYDPYHEVSITQSPKYFIKPINCMIILAFKKKISSYLSDLNVS